MLRVYARACHTLRWSRGAWALLPIHFCVGGGRFVPHPRHTQPSLSVQINIESGSQQAAAWPPTESDKQQAAYQKVRSPQFPHAAEAQRVMAALLLLAAALVGPVSAADCTLVRNASPR